MSALDERLKVTDGAVRIGVLEEDTSNVLAGERELLEDTVSALVCVDGERAKPPNKATVGVEEETKQRPIKNDNSTFFEKSKSLKLPTVTSTPNGLQVSE